MLKNTVVLLTNFSTLFFCLVVRKPAIVGVRVLEMLLAYYSLPNFRTLSAWYLESLHCGGGGAKKCYRPTTQYLTSAH